MKEPTDEQLERSLKRFEEASLVSDAIIEFVESKGINIQVAVVAMGIAYAAGAVTIDMPLPAAIDLVRGAYKARIDQNNLH